MFEEILAQLSGARPEQTSLTALVINLLLAALLAFALASAYARWSRSLSDRRSFARNFYLITMSITLIISVVKSSLALSLGLVGALSIVRFRTAIKDPEELSYLFIAIGIGLGLGANQPLVTTLSFLVILCVVAVVQRGARLPEAALQRNMNLLLVTQQSDAEDFLSATAKITSEHCGRTTLRRYERRGENVEVSYDVELRQLGDFDRARAALLALDGDMDIVLVDSLPE